MVRSRSPGPDGTPSGWVRYWHCSNCFNPHTYSSGSTHTPISSRSSAPGSPVSWAVEPTRQRKISLFSASSRSVIEFLCEPLAGLIFGGKCFDHAISFVEIGDARNITGLGEDATLSTFIMGDPVGD